MSFRSRPLAAAIGLILCAIVCAQWRVEPQIVGDPVPSVRYGWGPGRRSFPTSVPMRSEVRYARWSTGTTPSEFRMNMRAAGPNPPQGAMAGVSPPGPRFSRGSVGTVGNFVANEPGPPRTSFLAPEAGSIRYAPDAGAPARAASVNRPGAAPASPRPPANRKVTPGPINRSVRTGSPTSAH
jgi:hypothetical protein